MLMLLLLPHPLLQYPAPASVSIPLGLSYPALRENTHQRFILTRSPLRRRPVLSLEASAANGSVDEEQVSSRRLDRMLFMAAAGRDVCLAPSIQLHSDGFSPLFYYHPHYFPAWTKVLGSRTPPPLSSPLLTRHSSRQMEYEPRRAWSKNIYCHEDPPLYDTMQICFCLLPLNSNESRCGRGERSSH